MVAAARARDDLDQVTTAVSTTVAILVAVSMIAVAVAISATFLPWGEILGTRDDATSDLASQVALIVLVTTAISIPFGLVPKILFSLQEGYLGSSVLAVGTGAGAAAFLLLTITGVGLSGAALGWQVAPVCVLAGTGMVLARRRPWLRPRRSQASRTMAMRLLKLGGLFFVLQIAIAIAYESDVVVASNVLGTSAATTYAITLQLFSVGAMFAGLVNLPLWPAYAEALAKRDHAWVWSTFKRSVVFSFCASAIPAFGLLALGPTIIDVWVGLPINLDPVFLVGAAIWTVVYSTCNAMSILLNAANVVRFQVFIATAMAAASVILSYTLAHPFGLAGIVWGTLVSYVIFAAIPLGLYLPRLSRRLVLGTS